MPHDIVKFVDGALLVDLWGELVLPRQIRSEWNSTLSSR